jgi:hypothetical protein
VLSLEVLRPLPLLRKPLTAEPILISLGMMLGVAGCIMNVVDWVGDRDVACVEADLSKNLSFGRLQVVVEEGGSVRKRRKDAFIAIGLDRGEVMRDKHECRLPWWGAGEY